MIRAVIIDDEEFARKTLKAILKKQIPEIEVLGMASSALTGLQAIKTHKPELVFLDIEMIDGNGFVMLDSLQTINFDVIFVTAHAEYALKAFKYSALDFILKPIDPSELHRAISKYRKRTTEEQKIDHRMDVFRTMSLMSSKVPIPYKNGLKFVEVENVIRLEADGSYVSIYTTVTSPCLVCKTLKSYEPMLNDAIFLRVHRSHIVNIKYVSEYKRDSGGHIVLTNGETIQVSESRREAVLKKLSE